MATELVRAVGSVPPANACFPTSALGHHDLKSFVALTKADELMVVCSVHDQATRICPSL
jgi:hypothetical protein